MSTSWRFAFSSNAFKRFSLLQTVSDIGRAGYQGIEIFADTPHVGPRSFSREYMAGLKAALDKFFLAVSSSEECRGW